MRHFDVAVVGGGIAGTSVASFVSADASVVVLEREAALGAHSTGRSAAVFTECYGEPVVRRLAMASRQFVTDPPDGFTDAAIVSPRGIVFAATAEQVGALPASLAQQQALVPSVRGLGGTEVTELCPVLDPDAVVAGVYEPDAMDLDVAALHAGYQRTIRGNGGEIRTGAELEDAERGDGSWVLSIGGERIGARVVVNAAGAWCDVVAARCGVVPVGLVPKRRTAFAFVGPDGHRDWPMVIDFDEQWYFKPEGPNVLASPADAVPVEPHDVRHREEDVARGIERIEAVSTLRIRSVRTAWAGLRSFVADSRPLNGWDDSVPGFYWLAGQGGFGIKTSPAMGRYAAAMILTGEPGEADRAAGLTADDLGIDRLRA